MKAFTDCYAINNYDKFRKNAGGIKMDICGVGQ
jgi:hypothetical protein